MNNKTRLLKIEKTVKPNIHTWKDFVTGEWKPSPKEWQEFLLQAEISFQVMGKNGATVHFFDGHTEQVKEPLEGVKTYIGIDPSKWKKNGEA